MHTCLSKYESACVDGRYLVYSVRADKRRRPVAHIGLMVATDNRVAVQQVRGFANALVEPAMETFAWRLAAMNQGFVIPDPDQH